MVVVVVLPPPPSHFPLGADRLALITFCLSYFLLLRFHFLGLFLGFFGS